MDASVSAMPSTDALSRVLLGMLRAPQGEVVDRRRNNWSSSFSSEIVTCRLNANREVRLFCKYQFGEGHRAHGHRAGVVHEGAVYDRVLDQVTLPTARFHGVHVDPLSAEAWLVIDFLAGARSADEIPAAGHALRRAAHWIGSFHAMGQARIQARTSAFLIGYDAEYFAGWARRTSEFTAAWHERLPWLPALCRHAEGLAESQAAVAPTIIHGEFTPSNILAVGSEIYPVDWESAAVGMGEIDLVALVHKWPRAVATACQDEYVHARWPAGPPADFDRRLDLARLYWEMRWLGDRPEWLAQPKLRARLKHLRSVSARLGFVDEVAS